MSTQTEAERLAETLDVEIFVTMEDLKQSAAELRRLELTNTELQAEILDQCRINGMGADREDALRAEVVRLKQSAQKFAAIKTLEFLGYTYNGGEQWKPPIGKRPDWIDAEEQPAPEIAIADAFRAGVDSGIASEREACGRVRAAKPRELRPVGAGTLLDEQQYCFEKGWREGAASVRNAIRARKNT